MDLTVMETPMIRALRQAQLYGHLVARTGRLYHPGGSRPVCSVQTGLQMARAGWLARRGDRYEITREGLRALEPERDPSFETGEHASPQSEEIAPRRGSAG
jgi:hypothetical protein